MTQPTYDDIRQQIQRRYTRWTWFIFHVIMAVVTVAVIWAIDPTPQDGTPVLAALWGGVLLCHFIKIFIDGSQDRALERAWQRYSEALVLDEKPKRAMRLTDDGELEVVDEKSKRLTTLVDSDDLSHQVTERD
jgi:hypothetical protein